MQWLTTLQSVILLVFGFGFVIFIHELGHFLAAKWVGIKVEQFAVGFGQAICSWRPGMGFTLGSSGRKLAELQRQHDAGVSGIDLERFGDTEYRINWIPLGGYVKMLGQDDMRPGVDAEDPRAYNKKSIGARMLVVSAGVVMNVILAAIGFMVVFLIGLKVPPAVVGSVVSGSPAQHAGLQVGDRILSIDGKTQHDFTKIMLESALAEEGQPLDLLVRRRAGGTERMQVTPVRASDDSKGFLMLGIGQPVELRGSKLAAKLTQETGTAPSPAMLAIGPDEVVVAIDGEPLGDGADAYKTNFWKLDAAVQQSNGRPVRLSLRNDRGQQRDISVQPTFMLPFGAQRELNFAGMLPRTRIEAVTESSSALGKLLPGDVITAVITDQGKKSHPTRDELVAWLSAAGANDKPVQIEVLRDGRTVRVEDLRASLPLGNGQYGLGIQLLSDDQHAVIAQVTEGSPAAEAGLPAGARIASMDGQPVESWFDVQRLLAQVQAGRDVQIEAILDGESARTYELKLTASALATIRDHRLTVTLLLHELVEPRHTSNPLVAAWWGVTETRDFVLQFYVTIRRMLQGSVSYTNMMGPVGIFAAGTKFADRGMDWLIWFLAMISANLAVVNFLPIPIVDGGLFTFLIIEKIQGRPLSQRAQMIAQYVGLAVLAGVFLLVTYQDIARMLPH